MGFNIEQIIKDAERKGAFNNLPGKGKPLPEDQFKDLPDEIRMTYRILKEADVAPSEVNLKKSIEELKKIITDEQDEVKKKELRLKLVKLETEFNLKLENLSKSSV